MIKPTISETPYGISLDLRRRGVEAATFLAKNGDSILGKDGAEYLQSTVRPTVSTPLVEIFNKASALGKLKSFTMFDLTGIPEVPTVLTLDDITIDGKYISTKMPSAYQNVWLNLTPILGRSDAYNRTLVINDTIRFANQIARGILCMSYNDSEAWLTPNLNVKIIEAYSLLFAMHLKNRFNLDMNEYGLVRTLFAAYCAQMLDGLNTPQEIPPLLYRCKFLYQDTGTPRTIDDRFATIAETRKKIAPNMKLNIDIICKILNNVGPGRMKQLTERTLYVFMSRSPMDSQTMLFAMDYPPYFVYLLLNNLRGGKNPMFQNLLKFGDMKRRILDFGEELVNCKLFVERVMR